MKCESNVHGYLKNLILLKRGADYKKNLIFIHDGSGEINIYIPLCSYINNNYNCWGIRVDNAIGNAPQNDSIENIGRKYLELLRVARLSENCILAGWSNGGTIAFEIARQLEEAGENVELMMLIDTSAPIANRDFNNAVFNYENERHFFDMVIEDRSLKDELNKADSVDKIYKVINENLELITLEKLRNSLPPEIVQAIPSYALDNTKEFLYYANIVRTLGYARLRYVPKTKLTKQVYFIKASGSTDLDENAWNDFCVLPVSSYVMQGTHISILLMPGAINISNIINSLI